MEGRVISLETGDDVRPGEEGEILLKGPNVMVAQLDALCYFYLDFCYPNPDNREI